MLACTAVVKIEQKTASDLSDELACVGGKCLVSVLDTLDSGTEIRWTEQSNEGITYADKLAKGELDIAPELTFKEALLRVQASSDNHPCRCEIAGRRLTIMKGVLGFTGHCSSLWRNIFQLKTSLSWVFRMVS